MLEQNTKIGLETFFFLFLQRRLETLTFFLANLVFLKLKKMIPALLLNSVLPMLGVSCCLKVASMNIEPTPVVEEKSPSPQKPILKPKTFPKSALPMRTIPASPPSKKTMLSPAPVVLETPMSSSKKHVFAPVSVFPPEKKESSVNDYFPSLEVQELLPPPPPKLKVEVRKSPHKPAPFQQFLQMVKTQPLKKQTLPFAGLLENKMLRVAQQKEEEQEEEQEEKSLEVVEPKKGRKRKLSAGNELVVAEPKQRKKQRARFTPVSRRSKRSKERNLLQE